jgi:hypothetical protein
MLYIYAHHIYTGNLIIIFIVGLLVATILGFTGSRTDL